MDKSLYIPYKVVGHVIDSNPFIVNRLGDEIFITVTIGRAFQVYRLDHLIVCLVSRPASDKISSTQVSNHETFAAVGKQILVYDRNRQVRAYNINEHQISGLYMVGSILLSYDESNCVKILDTKARCLFGEINLLQSAKISTVLHPATYLNKFLFGYQNGELELWNIKIKNIVYTFKSHLEALKSIHNIRESNYKKAPSITCLEQSPACDVIGVGFDSGDILLLNLKLDKVLFAFSQEDEVTSISFRTDIAAMKLPLMASGSRRGSIHIWHLGGGDGDNNKRRLLTSLDDAHGGRVSRVHFLHGEPILISSGVDNSLKVWIFDSADGSARLLRSREGPSGTLTRIRHYGGDTEASMRESAEALSCELLCTSDDGSLRILNTALPSHSREFSQQTIIKKLGFMRKGTRLPPITGLDFSETRQRDWGNIVTIHQNHSSAYVWRHKHRTITETVLRQPNWTANEMMHHADRSTHATAVSVSCCGNFAVVGCRSGVIYLYNLQSGLPRGAFPPSAEHSVLKQGTIASRKATPGNVLHEREAVLASNGPNVGKGSLRAIKADATPNDKKLTKPAVTLSHSERHTMEITGLFFDPCSGYLVSCSLDGKVLFWDLSSREVIQKVVHKSPQLKLVPYKDGGFIAVVGQDRIVRVYDLSSKKLARRFDGHSREITDVAFTPDGRRLLSSSLDATVRVWDMPTGRCLSWMKFDSPVMSVGISLSGDQMSLIFSERDGVHTYIDKSLYQTVHFWNEPKEPTLMSDCVTRNDETGFDDQGEDTAEISEDVDDDEGKKPQTESDVDNQMQIQAVQGQVDTGESRESTAQRGKGLITMSDVPKAYWVTLFNLEEIKLRNKAKEPPKPPAPAPFFLPMVVRDGSALSFPTPQEYNRMLAEPSVEKDTTNVTLNDKKRALGSDVAAAAGGGGDKKLKAESENNESGAPEPETFLTEDMPQLGSVWADDGEEEDGEGEGLDREISTAGIEDDGGVGASKKKETASSTIHSESRILRRQTKLPRCALAVLLEKCYGLDHDSRAEHMHSDPMESDELVDVADHKVTSHLISLGPPAVDLEFRALCEGAHDEEGLLLIEALTNHISLQLQSATRFELYQAYLRRLLYIHSELILACPRIGRVLRQLQEKQERGCDDLRNLIHSNLCMLKFMANLPPT